MVICKKCQREFETLDSLRRHRVQKHKIPVEINEIELVDEFRSIIDDLNRRLSDKIASQKNFKAKCLKDDNDYLLKKFNLLLKYEKYEQCEIIKNILTEREKL